MKIAEYIRIFLNLFLVSFYVHRRPSYVDCRGILSHNIKSKYIKESRLKKMDIFEKNVIKILY